MPLTILNNTAYFALPMPLSDFPQRLLDHLNEYPNTPQIEVVGSQLSQSGFPVNDIPNFVTLVCEWGGKQGVRILDRILTHNTHAEIADALKKATLSLAHGQFVNALSHVDNLRFLDVSFASKHLRFLRPDICPVFDSILHDALPYTLDASGYSAFANDCSSLAQTLAANHIVNPRQRHGGAWFVADVEGAMYMFARQ